MILEVRDLALGYGARTVVQDVSFAVGKGEVVALLGPNGAGKTTLFRAILGSVPVRSGSITLNGQKLSTWTSQERARRMAYVPQLQTPAFPFRCLDAVALGCLPGMGRFACPGTSERARALEELERLGIAHLAERPITDISGGERQRVLIARALCQRAPLLLLDEPTAHLDFGETHRALKLVRELADRGLAVLWTTHDPDQALRLADRAVVLDRGQMRAFGPPGDILDHNFFLEVFGVRAEATSITISDGRRNAVCRMEK